MFDIGIERRTTTTRRQYWNFARVWMVVVLQTEYEGYGV